MKIGSHVSLKEPDLYYGSVLEAISYNANALMVYTGAPQNTRRKPLNQLKIEEAKKLIKEYDLEVIVHAPYIINLASPDIVKRDFAVSFLKEEIIRADGLGAKYIVVHPGAYTQSDLETGINNAIDSLNKVLEDNFNVLLCIETMAGKGTEVGYRFEQIEQIISSLKNEIGVCVDTCHIHDSGYDIKNNFEAVLKEFDEIIGSNKIKVIHLNDSKNDTGAKKDRHANIGEGYIGFDVLKKIANDKRFENVAKILETPYIEGIPPYKEEIERLKK